MEILDTTAIYYIFGSRAKGTNKEYSDIDIAISLHNSALPISVLTKINLDFENSTLPYKVDVIDLNAINDNFKNIIKDSLVRFN